MDWVKQKTDYYRDLAVAMSSDAAEVMFMRGNALAGETESSGFIPDELLHHLTRRPQHAKTTARVLVKAGLWERVVGGYQIVSFARINEELERLIEKKRRDRERKRRARSAPVSEDVSADSPSDGHADSLYDSERKTKKKTAAAAADAAAAALPTSIAILRDKLQAHSALQALRFDDLGLDREVQLEALIERHGDQKLVDVALRTLRTPPPVHVSAFLKTWAALPAPGQRLAAVPDTPCPEPGHSGTTRHCVQCAAERLAGDAR